MELFVSSLLFTIAFFAAIYLPGYVLCRLLGLRVSPQYLFSGAVAGGVVLFLLTTYGLAFIGLEWMYYFIIAGGVIYLFFQRKSLRMHLPKRYWPASLAIIFCAFFTSLLTLTSGILTRDGWRYVGINAHDGLVHIARIKNLLTDFPPLHPALSDVEFRGYHFFYDFLMSRFSLLFGFSPEDLYFRFFSIVSALVLGLGVYTLSTRLTRSNYQIVLAILFAFFASGFGEIINLFSSITYGYEIVQPFTHIYDPSIPFSVGLLLIAFSFLPEVKTYRTALFIGLTLGILSQIKVYAGIIAIVVLVTYTAYIFFKRRNHIKYYLLINVVTAVITAVTFLPNNLGAGSLVFAPLLFYSHYIQQKFFSFMHWEIKRTIFASDNNYLRIAFLYIQAIGIFWLITLGFRLILLWKARRLVSRDFWRNDYNAILFVAIVFPIGFASIFLQSISLFDMGQFFWIVLVLMGIPMGIMSGEWLKDGNYFQKAAVVVLVISYFIHPSLLVYKSLSSDHHVATYDQALLFDRVSRQVGSGEHILVLPGDVSFRDLHASKISALTGKPTYYEHEIITYPLDEVYSTRLGNIEQLQEALRVCDEDDISQLMRRIGTKHIISYYDVRCMKVDKLGQADGIYYYQFSEDL